MWTGNEATEHFYYLIMYWVHSYSKHNFLSACMGSLGSCQSSFSGFFNVILVF